MHCKNRQDSTSVYVSFLTATVSQTILVYHLSSKLRPFVTEKHSKRTSLSPHIENSGYEILINCILSNKHGSTFNLQLLASLVHYTDIS
jgi:hypothetical protein